MIALCVAATIAPPTNPLFRMSLRPWPPAPPPPTLPPMTFLRIPFSSSCATREIVPMRWGFIGHRTKGPGPTITPQSPVRIPSNGALFGANRCTIAAAIIPANGYFEWLQPQGFPTASPSSIPKCSLLLVYGTLGKDPSNGEWTQSFAIITTHGNEILVDFNDNYNDEEDPRMPVILQPNDYDYWLTVTKSTNPAQTYWCPTMRIERLLGQPIPRWAISQQPRPRRPAPRNGKCGGFAQGIERFPNDLRNWTRLPSRDEIPEEGRGKATMKKLLALLLCVMISTMAFGRDDGYGVSYDGGSVQGIKTGASLKIHVDSNQIRFTQGKQDVLVIPASAVSEITYGQDVHRRVGAAIGLAVVSFGIGGLMALTKSKKHYVGLTWADGDKKGGLAIQCDKNDYRGVLAALEGVTGKKATDSETMTVKN